jgi:hypothetical protein
MNRSEPNIEEYDRSCLVQRPTGISGLIGQTEGVARFADT